MFRLNAGLGAIVAGVVMQVVPANAAGTTPESASVKHGQHLLQATVDAGGALLGGDVDGHYRDEGKYWGVGAGYSYALTSVDLGAAFHYLAAPDPAHPVHVFIPTLLVRPHLPLAGNLELGVGLRAGWSWLAMPDFNGKNHVFSGPHLGLTPDVRIWVSRRLALDGGAELLATFGRDTVREDINTNYLDRDAPVIALGGFIRLNLALGPLEND